MFLPHYMVSSGNLGMDGCGPLIHPTKKSQMYLLKTLGQSVVFCTLHNGTRNPEIVIIVYSFYVAAN